MQRVSTPLSSLSLYSMAVLAYPILLRLHSVTLKCLDCGIPYSELGLDLVLPDKQWLMIHPEGLHGILCASCIVKRAEKLEGTTVVIARIE